MTVGPLSLSQTSPVIKVIDCHVLVSTHLSPLCYKKRNLTLVPWADVRPQWL